MKPTKNLLLSILFILTAIVETIAQASLAAENQITDIPVILKSGKKKVYSVFRDNAKKNQWYYMPNELRVAEDIGPTGKPKPKVTVLRYQYQDKMDKTNKEGGVVVATFTYAMEPEAVDQVKKAIIAKTKDNSILMSAIPFNKSKIEFLLGGTDFVVKADSNSKSSNAGPTSASQEITKAFEITALGTGIFQGLLRSAGWPFACFVTYNGVTPPCGYKVTGKYDNVYKYYEDISKKEGSFSIGFGGFALGGGVDKSKKSVSENMHDKQAIKLETFPCSNEKMQDIMIKKALDVETSILTQITGKNITTVASELEALQSMIDKTTDESAKTKLMEMFNSKYGSAQFGLQQSIQDIKKRRKGDIIMNNAIAQMVTRSTVISGGISISKYYPGKVTEQQLIKDGILVDIDANAAFPSVIISLPSLNPELGLRALAVEVGYKTSDGKTITEARTWDATKGWTTPTGVKAEYIRFNLLGEKNVKERQEPKMKIKMVATSSVPNASFTIEKTHKLSIGERNMDPMEILTKQIVVDGSILDYRALTQNPDDLAYAKVQFTHGANLISKDVKPQYVNGSPAPPNTVYFLLPNDDKPITNNVIYFKNNGTKIEKPNSLSVGENTLLNEWKSGI